MEWCIHDNISSTCYICNGRKKEVKPVKVENGDVEKFEDVRCDLCDAPCKRKRPQKTWICSVCSWRSNISKSNPAKYDFYLYDQSTGPQGGRSELQKMTNQFKNKYWIKIPRERREQILNEQDKLSYEYYSRMKLFFQFNPR